MAEWPVVVTYYASRLIVVDAEDSDTATRDAIAGLRDDNPDIIVDVTASCGAATPEGVKHLRDTAVKMRKQYTSDSMIVVTTVYPKRRRDDD